MSLPPTFTAHPLATALLASLAIGVGIVLTRTLHGKYSFDTVVGVQKVHHEQVPRIGGVAIFLGFLLGQLLALDLAEGVLESTLALGLIAFSFGLMEDLSKKVPVALRLWATMVPGVVGYFLTGYTLNQFGYGWLDLILQWPIVSIAFTAFAICGVTHAINMIDGFNGLAGWTSVWILLGIAIIALSVGDVPLAMTATLIVASVLGFLAINWPWGKLFLGDGGAYFLGVSIAWLCVMLVSRNPQVSPFACLVLCSYPITEVLYSIARRTASRMSSGRPDRLHLHQLIAITLIYPRLASLKLVYKNSVTGFAVSCLSIPAVILAITYSQEQATLVWIFGAVVLGYIALYRIVRGRMNAKSNTQAASEVPSQHHANLPQGISSRD
jgi:UDP-N-acetylmuramyl pentapeptide phosphotransferase/UDP-N-acetylglucosamine-1-phosphate transferase